MYTISGKTVDLFGKKEVNGWQKKNKILPMSICLILYNILLVLQSI